MGRLFKISSFLVTIWFVVVIAKTNHGWAGEAKTWVIGTGNPTGVYHATGEALAKLINRYSDETGLRLDNQVSQGSEQNINDVLTGKITLGLAQADMLFKVQKGLGKWKGQPQGNLCGIFSLYTEALTLVAASDAGIVKVADLAGKRVNIGAPGSSDNENARILLEISGLPPENLQLREEPSGLASKLLQNNEIDAYFYTVGHPNLSVREASEGLRKVQLVPLSPALVARLAAARPYLLPVTIPVDQYPKLENTYPVLSIGVKAVLFSRSDLNKDGVNHLVQTVLEHLQRFRWQHPALVGLKAKDLAEESILPMHPGAVEAFRKAGVLP